MWGLPFSGPLGVFAIAALVPILFFGNALGQSGANMVLPVAVAWGSTKVATANQFGTSGEGVGATQEGAARIALNALGASLFSCIGCPTGEKGCVLGEVTFENLDGTPIDAWDLSDDDLWEFEGGQGMDYTATITVKYPVRIFGYCSGCRVVDPE